MKKILLCLGLMVIMGVGVLAPELVLNRSQASFTNTYVPYTGATTNVNLGSKTLTTT